MEISFLIDTNVAIQLEEVGGSGRIREPFQKLHALLIEYRLKFFVHPASREDLANDSNARRREEMLSRLGKYPHLSDPPTTTNQDLEKLFGGSSKPNDVVDCKLLFALVRNCVSYFITEDEGIHRRAHHAGIDDRVLYVREAADLIIRQFKPTSIRLPSVAEELIYNLDLKSPFFDSLKSSYSGFEDWFRKSCQLHRKCWTIRVGEDLAGLCIYKHDEKEEHQGITLPSIKLCTFKIADEYRGRKYGELLLKMAFNYATKNKVHSIWVTVQAEHSALIYLLKSFGFQVHSQMKGNDLIFYKYMKSPKGLPKMAPLDFHVRYSPEVYDDNDIVKYVIPIRPQFHDTLFPEFSNQLPLASLSLAGGIPGNTIRKVYLSGSNIRNIDPGSLIYFYRSGSEQYICTLGIVEKARRLDEIETIAAAIGKRSVYTYAQVEQMLGEKEILIINFRLISHAESPVGLKTLVKKGIFNHRPPQTIMKLPHNRFLKLKALWI